MSSISTWLRGRVTLRIDLKSFNSDYKLNVLKNVTSKHGLHTVHGTTLEKWPASFFSYYFDMTELSTDDMRTAFKQEIVKYALNKRWNANDAEVAEYQNLAWHIKPTGSCD